MNSERFTDLPGAELVIAGLDDLVRGTLDSTEALLVAIGAPACEPSGSSCPILSRSYPSTNSTSC